MRPTVVINLKTYKQGKDVVKIVNEVEKYDKNIIVGVQASDLSEMVKKTKLSVFIQHVDPFRPGRNTGYITPESIKKLGVKGAFLNHSEHKLDFDVLKETVKRCNEVRLKTLIFASNLKEAIKIKTLKPDYLVIEPPELVAGDVSVSRAKPELVENISKKLKYPFLVGAGIKTNEDVKIALRLGAIGIAVSSAVTLSQNVNKTLKQLLG